MGKCACQQNKATPDRYISFDGIDCEGNARLLMEMILAHVNDPAKSNKFWDYFLKKREGGRGPKPDDLFLIHSNLNQIRELFEQYNDELALKLLDKIEIECC